MYECLNGEKDLFIEAKTWRCPGIGKEEERERREEMVSRKMERP